MDSVTRKTKIEKILLHNIPPMPYATHSKSGGCYREKKAVAIANFEYIQLNPSTNIQTIVLDCDNNINLLDWSVLPCPNLVVMHKDKRNFKTHLFYVLAKAVPLNSLQTEKQKTLLTIVKKGLTEKLEADPAFGGLLSKNPFCGAWVARVFRQEPYTLKELRSYIDDDNANEILKAKKAQKSEGFRQWFAEVGRNCELFETLRFWAYSQVHFYHGKSFDAFISACLEHATTLNNKSFKEPLGYREVQDVAKKIARWTWSHLTAQQSESNLKENLKKMSELGRKKGLETRQRNRAKKLAKFESIYDPNKQITIAEASRAVGVSVRTGKQFWKEIKEAQSNAPTLPGLEGGKT